ncbi:MAG: DUF106 domain-containing protein [Promethearchaeota archaeon]|nr:MAG: DUF106 domain-containing protein [Candidatus Lokiarchaeota archaeon]
MALEPLTIDIIFELMYISIGLVLLGLLLNWLLGLKPEVMRELRDKAKNLQDRIQQAQILGDQQLMMELQQETMALMKQMLKKQLAPMAIRCVIFLGIFALLSFYYGKYEYWFWVYFGFSLAFSLLAFGVRKGYQKITGKEAKKEKFAKELMGTISPSQSAENQIYIPSNVLNSSERGPSIDLESLNQEATGESDKTQEGDAWKDRMKK